ncbi:EPIDERMAL PATTERNING FACTOR-like protein 8 [Ricinus communis]|uniref:Epidermal patterning factor-like protein n=1 Tax=Ricinus communis TaxID=3988 RepID=B9SET8_RICCO|nr:EPIDERMAL PATTERNING FACTOR-like protein 8 [Ricinus communis]EEF37947.1 hypothetical protein RCOM_0224470 [Ricinus communis]|eukprot:XP_025014087.1 EPIDERMAL PATTERNING FACTOR-like protein 8 [Ricinus communis]
MASLAYYPNGLTRIPLVILMFIFFLPFFSSTSVLTVGSSPYLRDNDGKQMKMVLGSRPPQCINRCLNCRPCMAALVTPPHHKTSLSRGDESYYLLSWKCKCGDKYFQP